MQQWVDITTIDNSTPFMKVRWKSLFSSVGDSWFAESPGIVSDNMSWTDGTKDYGWFSAHRLNSDNYYCCSFDFDHSMPGYWDESGQTYRVTLKDAFRDQYYDTTVQISGETYYEVDFNLWSGASGYQLYAPYSVMPWAPGDIYVYAGLSDISGDKDKVSYKSTGGTNIVSITAVDDWTATQDANWFTVSSLSGTSGTTSITVTAPDYQDTTSARTGTVTFSCNGDTFVLTVRQSKKLAPGFGGLLIGNTDLENMYLASEPLDALYLGTLPIFERGIAGLKLSPASETLPRTGGTFNLTVKSAEQWNLSFDSNYISASPVSGDSGVTVVTVVGVANTGATAIDTVITATSTNFSATTSVTLKGPAILPSDLLFNYNAKEFVLSGNGGIMPNASGATAFTENLEILSGVSNTGTDYIDLDSTISATTYTFPYGTSPFNRDSSNPELTVIAKIGSMHGSSSDYSTAHLLSSRNPSDPSRYNWMVRIIGDGTGVYLHDSGSGVRVYGIQTYPNTFYIKVNSSSQATIDSITDSVENSGAITYGPISDAIAFFSGGNSAQEIAAGRFYWMFCIDRALTDSEIQDVIEYNEELPEPPTAIDDVGFGPAMSASVTVDWNTTSVGINYSVTEGEVLTITHPGGISVSYNGPATGVDTYLLDENVGLNSVATQINCVFSGNTAFTKTLYLTQSPIMSAVVARYVTSTPNQTVKVARNDASYTPYTKWINGYPEDQASSEGSYDGNGYFTFTHTGTNIITYYFGDGVDTLPSIIQDSEVRVAAASSNITSIANYGFANCMLMTDFSAPSVTYLGNKVFQYDSSLTGVTLGNLTHMGDNAFRATSIPEFHFGDAISSVSYNLFNGAASLSALTFDANTTGLTYFQSVGDNTTSLTEVVFPDCVETYCQNSMQYGLFYGSSSLSAVTFGSGATTFQGLVFGGNMPALTSITCKATIAPSIVSGCFSGVTSNVGTLYVPQGSDYSTWAAELGSNWTVSDTL